MNGKQLKSKLKSCDNKNIILKCILEDGSIISGIDDIQIDNDHVYLIADISEENDLNNR